MKKRTGSFGVTGTDGRQYTVYIYADFIEGLECLKELWTSDGMPVHYRKQGEYEIVQTGVVLRSSSPNAP